MGVNGLNKFIFWFSVIVLVFMPFGIIMSFALLLLYYGVPYIKSELGDVCAEKYTIEQNDSTNDESINKFSDDTLEEMR